VTLDDDRAAGGPSQAVTRSVELPAEFPPSIGKVAHRALAQHGYTRWEQLTTVTSAELLRIHGVGPKAVTILSDELAARQLSFKTP